MILLELAAQGLRGAVPASGRAVFRPGYVALQCDADALHALLAALLWGDEQEAAALRLAAGHAVRAGCTFSAIDRSVYRLLSDLATDVQLQRYDASSRTFSAVAADRASVGVFLADRAELPSRRRFEAMHCLRAVHLPSRTAGAPRAVAPARASSVEPERIRAHLAELRADLQRSRTVEALQAHADELHSRLSQLEDALREGERLTTEHASASARLRSLDALADAASDLGDVDARLAAHDRATARREEAESRISEERAAIASSAAAPPPPWRLPSLWAGVAVGVGALAVGLSSGGATRYLALLDIPAFGFAAWTALRWVGRLEGAERAGRRARVVDERERKMIEQWESEAGAVRRAMVAAGVSDVAELRRALGALQDARAAEQASREALDAWHARPEAADAEREQAEVHASLQETEAKLAALAGGFVRDVGTLEAEIARLEGELATASAQSAATTGHAAAVDVIAQLAHDVAAELGGSGAPLQRLEQRTGEILASVSGHRVEGLWAGTDARAVMPSGRSLPLADLPVEARDLCWVALKLAILEHEVEAHGGFALVDGAADGLPLSARRVAAHILKRAARGGQVLHVTSEPIFREAADHAA